MAISQATETVALTVEERTWRLEVFTEKGSEYSVRAHRETIKMLDGEPLPAIRGAVIERSLSQVQDEAFFIAGKEYTGGEIANVLSAIADVWREQDLAAARSLEAQADV